MKNIIKDQPIDRHSSDLQSVVIDDIKISDDYPDFFEPKPVSPKRNSNIKIIEEAQQFRKRLDIQKAKKESCCYKYCNCTNNQNNDDLNDYNDNCFWYWYWYLYSSNENKESTYSNNSNNDNIDTNCCMCSDCNGCTESNSKEDNDN